MCSLRTATSKTVWVENYYDAYDFLSEPEFANRDVYPAADAEAQVAAKNRLTKRIVHGFDGGIIDELIYYDAKGRVKHSVLDNRKGGHDITTTAYTYSGKPATVTHVHTVSNHTDEGFEEIYTYTYDYEDRLTQVQHKLGSTQVTLATYTYDDYGRLASKKLHGSATNRLTYSYNIRDWVTKITGSKFAQDLYYNTGNGTPCYNGNISSMTWKSGNESTTRGYKFQYDNLNRLTSATYGEGTAISSNANRFTEKVTGYDKNGNIKALQRYGQISASAYGLIDNLTFTQDGNRPTRVDDAVTASAYNNGFEFKDGVKQANEYAYDANGNLTKDLNKGISKIEYNFLNLPDKVEFTDGSTIEYTYLADGSKLRTVYTVNGLSDMLTYCGNVVYEGDVRKFLLTGEGYVTLADNKYHYYMQDHQGNNRVVIDQNGAVEEVNHYYPFGGVFASTSSVQPEISGHVTLSVWGE